VLPASARTGRSADRVPDGGRPPYAGARPAVRDRLPRPLLCPFPRRGCSRRLCSLSPAVRRRRREALTSASCVRTSACSRAHARRCRASGPANHSADGTARVARRCQEPLWALCGLEYAKYVPKPSAGVVHRLYLRRSADHRVRPARSFTRRPLYLCADELRHNCPSRLRARGDGAQPAADVEYVFC